MGRYKGAQKGAYRSGQPVSELHCHAPTGAGGIVQRRILAQVNTNGAAATGVVTVRVSPVGLMLKRTDPAAARWAGIPHASAASCG